MLVGLAREGEGDHVLDGSREDEHEDVEEVGGGGVVHSAIVHESVMQSGEGKAEKEGEVELAAPEQVLRRLRSPRHSEAHVDCKSVVRV